MNTEHYSYHDLFNEINLQTGGIATGINVYPDTRKPDELKILFEVRTKAL